jgi:glycosyltransferase involved in cell wall biosynthesis
LISALAEVDSETRYILFSAGRDLTRRVWPANFRTRALPLSDRQLSIIWHRLNLPLPVELATGRLDVLHSPDFVLPPVRRARTLLTVHDLSFLRFPECFAPPLLEYLTRNVPRSVARADLVLADSQSTHDDLGNLLGVPAERMRVLYPGGEPHRRPTVDPYSLQGALDRYAITRPYILAVGTLQPRKNYVRLIKAYALMRREHAVPHQLVIVGGRGWLFQEIDDTIRDLRLESQVRLAGYAPEGDLTALYQGAEMLAFPSLYEGFGLPVLEAMACGTPVITSTTSSLPEAAGSAALLVDPLDVAALAEALWRLVDDEALRNSLRTQGFQQVKRFSWAASARQLRAIYHGLGNGGADVRL